MNTQNLGRDSRTTPKGHGSLKGPWSPIFRRREVGSTCLFQFTEALTPSNYRGSHTLGRLCPNRVVVTDSDPAEPSGSYQSRAGPNEQFTAQMASLILNKHRAQPMKESTDKELVHLTIGVYL